MTLISVILSICLTIAFVVLFFIRKRYRLLALALLSASLFFLYLPLAMIFEFGTVNALSTIMLAVTAIAALVLLIAHFLAERGRKRDHPAEHDSRPGEGTPL